ncbi:MAG: RsmE family RNA methyltransferase [Desulfotignum sp.]
MQKFLIPRDRIRENKGVIAGPDARHVVRVLRLTTGDDLVFTDGMGTDFSGRILNSSQDQVVVEILDTRPSGTESPLSLTVCTGMLKHPKMDDVIQGLTQIGITRWIPFFCERSVPSPDKKALTRRMERWQTIANETIKQCRRSRLVDISYPTTLAHVLDMADKFDHCIAFWEQGGKPVSRLTPLTGHDKALLLIGPEGGFSESEIHQASAKGFIPCSLGPRILRAETASLCAAALVQHRLGDM